MKFLFFIATIIFSVTGLFAQDLAKDDCQALLLTKKGEEISLEKVAIPNNQVEIFPIKEDGENITIIFVYSAGMSGDFIKLSDKKMLIAQCRAGELKIKIRKADNSERELPPMNSADLSKYNIRVNVTGKTIKKAFRVNHKGEIEVDKNGPVIDMFGGKIPIGDTDYSITIEVTEAKTNASIKGAVPLEFNQYLFVKAQIGDGQTTDFIVDTAAAQSILAKNILPESIKLSEAKSVEYSEKGKRILDYAAGGAGGSLKGLMFAEVPLLKLGNLKFTDQSFLVIDALPKLGGREIGGIIGLDLLQQAKKISFSYPKNPNEKKDLVFSDQNLNAFKNEIKVPFTIAFNHLYLNGKIGSDQIEFILDTGSPDTIITDKVAQSANLADFQKVDFPIKGLDGKPINAQKSILNQLKIAEIVVPSLPVIVADLPVFQQRGLTKTGLMGNSFLKQFSLIEIDFESKLVRLLQ